MADYRLYVLNAEGRIQRALPLQCATDEEAIITAADHPNANGLELWQLERRVRTFPPPFLEQTGHPTREQSRGETLPESDGFRSSDLNLEA